MSTPRTPVLTLLLSIACTLSACDSRKQTPAASATPAATPTPAAAINWAAIKAADNMKSTWAFTHLARYADLWAGGKKDTVTLTFVGPSSVTDGDGHTGSITPEEWKGVVETLIRPHGGSATQAFPAASENYHDGLGKVPRFAYTVKLEGDAMVLTRVKAKGDQSDG